MAFWTIAYYEILHMVRKRSILFVTFVLPLLLIFILGSALSGVFGAVDRKVEPVALTVFYADAGAMAGQVEAFLSSGPAREYMKAEKAGSREEVEERIRNGASDYGLVVPSGFTREIMSGEGASLELVPGKSEVKNLTAEMALRGFTDRLNTVQAVAAVQGPDAAVAAVAAAGTGAPGVETVEWGNEKSETSAMQYYAASQLVMFLLFTGAGTAAKLAADRENQTLARLHSLPIVPARIMFGNLAGAGMFSIVQAVIIIVFTAAVYGVHWGNQPLLLLLVCVLTIISALSLALILFLRIKSSKNVDAFYSILIMVMTFLSGGTVPNVGEFLSRIGQGTINYWAAGSMIRMMLGYGLTDIAYRISILGCFAAGLTLLAYFGYRKAGYHE